MYFITNYDAWWKYEKSFTDFKSAMMIYDCLGDINNSIIYVDMESGVKQIVWDKSIEENYLNESIPCECSRQIQ